MTLAVAIFLAFAFGRNTGFWGYWASYPGAFSARSLGLLLSHGLLPLAAAGLFCLLAWGAGRRLMDALEGHRAARDRPLADGAAAPFALGLGAAGLGAFLLGASGALTPAGFGGLAFVLGIAAAPALRSLPAAWSRMGPAGPWPRWKSACAGLLAAAAWHGLIHALAPPTEWDVLAYHLAIPKAYAGTATLGPLPWLIHSHWPHLMETLYTAAILGGRDQAAALVHLAACAAFVAAAADLAREAWGSEAGWGTAAALAASGVLLRFGGTAHADGAAALALLCSCAVLARAKRPGPAGLAGLLCGIAVACKLTLAPAAVLLAAVALRRLPARTAAVFLAAAAAPAAPWLVRTWWAAGNPVWPFLAGVFGGTTGTAELARAYAASNHWAFPPPAAVLTRYGGHWLLLPALAAAPWGARGPWPEPWRLLAAAAAAAALPLWRHNELWRFLLPFHAIAAVVLARGLLRLGPAGAFTLALAAAAPLAAATQNNELFAVAGLESRLAPGTDPRRLYLERSLDHAAFFNEAAGRLAASDRVLLFREVRGYHLGADYIWGDPLNQGLVRYAELRDAPALRSRLESLGVTHVLVNEGLAVYAPGYYDAHTLGTMSAVLAEGRLVLRRGPLALYAIGCPAPCGA